jgi:septum formation protein
MFILASASSRRRELIAQLELRFEVVVAPPSLDETPHEGEGAEPYVERMALAKATASPQAHPEGAWILAADTIVAIDGAIVGKPADRDEARRTLTRLQGRAHRVMTAYALARDGVVLRRRRVDTEVLFAELAPARIDRYLDTGEWTDKAGGYGIQGQGGVFVRSISGSYSNVVGLPLAELADDLGELGLLRNGAGGSERGHR